jgi:hypothetical protein
MPVTAANLSFFAAAVLSDAADGGGRRSSIVLQNGGANGLFPDVSAGDRLAGQVRLRKFYPSLTNADTAALLSGGLALDQVPTDPATEVSFARSPQAGGVTEASTTRAAGLAPFQGAVGGGNPLATGEAYHFTGGTATAASNVVVGASFSNSALFDGTVLGGWVLVEFGAKRAVRRAVSRSGLDVTLDEPLPWSGTVSGKHILIVPGAPRSAAASGVFGAAPVFGTVANGASSVVLAKLGARIAPVPDGAALTTAAAGFGTLGGLAFTDGYCAVIYPGDIVTLWHETATSPATVTAGTALNVGRTDLDQLAVVDANGAEVARFLLNGPTPTPTGGAMTANLAAGTVTISSITGIAQPLTVRHRITHRAVAGALDGATVPLSVPTTREFPAGSMLSSHMPLGDVQARASNVFAQQAWTRVFSDTLIGNPTTLMYAGLPGVTNAGAEEDRYAVVFTDVDEYVVYSEALGRIGSGTTAADYSPLNPATGAPLFTLLAGSWSPSILVGSVLRFNTAAASPAVWALRCTVPSTASGTTGAAWRLLGSVDA